MPLHVATPGESIIVWFCVIASVKVGELPQGAVQNNVTYYSTNEKYHFYFYVFNSKC